MVKKMRKLRNRIDVRHTKKDYLKWKLKPNYMLQKYLTMIQS